MIPHAIAEFAMAHPLILTGLLLIAGYGLGKLFGRLRLPEISGFICAGFLVNVLTRGELHHTMNDALHLITETAIGLLALSVGVEFSRRKLQRIGRQVTVITLVSLTLTFGTVYLACIGLHRLYPALPVGYPYAILLAVIACATAPAVIVAEVHHMRAHGRFIDYLFGVTALGDALSVVAFGLGFTVVMNLLDVDTAGLYTVAAAFREIGMSILCGICAALLLHTLVRGVRNPNEYLIVTLGVVFTMTGIAIVLKLSPLLVNMALGIVLINLSSHHHRLFHRIEPLTPPIYALFFVIAGIEIDPAVFFQAGVAAVGFYYITARVLGRCTGVYAGARLCGLPPGMRRNLGIGLLSQGGIALGFVLLIRTSPLVTRIPEASPLHGVFPLLMNIVLISIFVNEMASPFCLRHAIMRGNEMEAPLT